MVKEQMEKGLVDIVIFTSNLSTNSALMVRKGLAYSLVIEGAVPFLDKQEIAYRPLYPELSANSVFAWKKQQPFSLAATKFIEHIKATYAFRHKFGLWKD